MSSKQVAIDPQAEAGTKAEHGLHEIAPDLAYQRLAIVNVIYAGLPGAGDRKWILIDAGMPGTAGSIRRAAAERFGKNARPAAILLTHGHFDHVGALKELVEEWDTPVIAHRLEYPYLNGRSHYPPPDPAVGGGIMAAVSGLYPSGPIDVRPWLQPYSDNGTLSMMPGWRWLATPGHTPGHISLWREEDRTLVAGDAFITTRQESAYAVLTQKPEIHGPPMYFTPDWESARQSVIKLAALQPELVISGHGPALQGPALRQALSTLADNFDRIAVPDQGRYVHTSASADQGA